MFFHVLLVFNGASHQATPIAPTAQLGTHSKHLQYLQLCVLRGVKSTDRIRSRRGAGLSLVGKTVSQKAQLIPLLLSLCSFTKRDSIDI